MVTEGGILAKLKSSIVHEHPLTKIDGRLCLDEAANQCDLYIFGQTNYACKFFICDCCLRHVNDSVTVAAKESEISSSSRSKLEQLQIFIKGVEHWLVRLVMGAAFL